MRTQTLTDFLFQISVWKCSDALSDEEVKKFPSRNLELALMSEGENLPGWWDE